MLLRARARPASCKPWHKRQPRAIATTDLNSGEPIEPATVSCKRKRLGTPYARTSIGQQGRRECELLSIDPLQPIQDAHTAVTAHEIYQIVGHGRRYNGSSSSSSREDGEARAARPSEGDPDPAARQVASTVHRRVQGLEKHHLQRPVLQPRAHSSATTRTIPSCSSPRSAEPTRDKTGSPSPQPASTGGGRAMGMLCLCIPWTRSVTSSYNLWHTAMGWCWWAPRLQSASSTRPREVSLSCLRALAVLQLRATPIRHLVSGVTLEPRLTR
jgi:hypothetical protein